MKQIVEKKVEQLRPYVHNPRVHSEEQVERIARSIREFGWTNPILVTADDEVLAGHGRLMAAQHLGLEEVPTLLIDPLTKEQARAYVIADNQTALISSWDDELLRSELAALQDADFDLSALGWGDDLPEFVEPPDYSILDDEDMDDMLDDLEGGAKRAIMIEFSPDHYPRAIAICKYWREQGADLGAMVLAHLEMSKEAQE